MKNDHSSHPFLRALRACRVLCARRAGHVHRAVRLLLLPSLLLAFSGCRSDWPAGEPSSPQGTRSPSERAIAFSAAVSSVQVSATRADGSLVNLNERSLPSTKVRTYWRAGSGGTVSAVEKEYYVGLFGCHTGQTSWSELVSRQAAGTLSDAEKQSYSANLLFNVRARIGEPSGGVNALSYDTLRYWPNNRYGEPSDYEKCTFFAYYPYNPTAEPGMYGVSITAGSMGAGHGMGSVKFTMHPDAAEQNDFMISAPVADCTRSAYPLEEGPQGTYAPRPVAFRFYHMLAQVRLYAFVRGTDKLVYKTDGEGNPVYYAAGETYTDAWGTEHTVTSEEAGTIQKIDEEKSVRWERTGYYDVRGEKKRADISYKLEFKNIKTDATFSPSYLPAGTTIRCTPGSTLGTATVNHYIMNPYWFRFDEGDQHRYMLNDRYMYGYFEDSPVYRGENATSAAGGLDGIDWSDAKWSGSKDPLHYLDLTGEGDIRRKELQDPDDPTKHYNYPPGNILMVVPQELSDEDVPHIVLTATGKDTRGKDITAKVTVNLLQMNLKWESGFIYSYAIVDELRPGDDIVRGPESITTPFDTSQYTDQW